MTKPQELRIGNWVTKDSNPGKPVCISGITDIDVRFVNSHAAFINLISPIPLTPDVLEKAGFKKNNHGCWSNIITIDVFLDGEYWYYYTGDDRIEILHLHQLQNLYFALTGEELPVELY